MYIGIDLGGTKIAAAITSPDGESIAARLQVPTGAEQGGAQVISNIIAAASELLERNPGAQLKGIGIGVPGRVRGDEILSAPNIPGLQQTSPADDLEKHFRVPVMTENDANAAALAEQLYGAGQGCQDFIYLTISTGIGGGIIQAGQLVSGAEHAAGEIGHIILAPDGPLCGCGQRGCLEAFASGTALGKALRQRLADPKAQTVIRDLVASGETPEAKHIGQALQQGDKLAFELLNDNARYLAQGLVTMIQILNPAKVIIGGGVSQLGTPYFSAIAAQLEALYRNEGVPLPEIVPSPLGQDSGVLGALALARQAKN